MPLPASQNKPSNRGSAKHTPSQSKELDIGESLGPYDTNPVREKIRKWQKQGGGVIVAPDVAGNSDDEKQPKKSDPEPDPDPDPESRETPESKRRERARRRRESTKPQRREDGDKNINGTPKKRVVSDGHWRKNRSPPHSASPSPSPRTTPRKRTERSNGKYEQAKSRFEENEQTKTSDSTPPTSSKLDSGDGIKVYAGPLKVSPSKTSTSQDGHGLPDEKSKDDCESPDTILKDRRKTTKGSGRQRRSSKDNLKTDKKFDSKQEPLDDNTRRHRRKTERPVGSNGLVEPPDGQRASPESRNMRTSPQPSPSKGGIFDQVIGGSKKIFSKPEPVSTERPHGSRVEAWLSGTPDPFVEEDPPIEIPAPLSSLSSRHAQSKSDGSEPASHAQFSQDRRHSNRQERRRVSRNQHDEPEKSSQKEKLPPNPRTAKSSERRHSVDSGSTGLKRAGAKKRPNSSYDSFKMSTLRESVEEALQESAVDDSPSSDGSEVPYSERPPPLTLRKPFPGTGAHRLSTIASVDTLDTENDSTRQRVDDKPPVSDDSIPTSRPRQQDDDFNSESRDHFDPDSLSRPAKTSLKRRLTKHSDLMSVLSAPAGDGRSIRSARSIRTNRSRLATATVSDILRELSSDETKYMRELRTLVGGVIPVLLTSVLSKTDSAVAAGLFRPLAKDDASITQPIVHMGVCLERLKALHKRIPLNNAESLLNWAQGAQKVYSDYLKAWRLGFQDVVVNLAPPEEGDPTSQSADAHSLWGGMSQDENGDVVDGEGERVDVAFLLKRPLVRLKYLSKTFKGLNVLQPSQKAEDLSVAYQTLVLDARRRSNEERARLEDDSAAAIDATRCRDLQSLAVLEDVTVDQKRRVRARDLFDLSLLHSTGQQVDCRCELLIRDNPPETGPGSDLFISEIDNSGRWLLFPPVDCECVSARRGDEKGEVVVMVRGTPTENDKWHELLSFKTDDEHVSCEWIEMLGTKPVPPKINRSLSFLNRVKDQNATPQLNEVEARLPVTSNDRAPTPTEINVPIGEQASAVTQRSHRRDSESGKARRHRSPENKADERSRTSPPNKRTPRTPTKPEEPEGPRSLNEAMKLAGGRSPGALKRTKAQKKPKHESPSPSSPRSPVSERTPDRYYGQSPEASESGAPARHKSPEAKPDAWRSQAEKEKKGSEKRPIADIPKAHGRRRSLSPVPSMEFPTIPRIRKKEKDPGTTPPSPLSPAVSDKSPHSRRRKDIVPSPDENNTDGSEPLYTEDVPPPPPHRTFVSPSPEPKQPKQTDAPVLSPSTARHRRTSSPLKHEYEPSTATETSLSDTSTVEHHDVYSSSTTSDEELEEDNIATPLPPISSQRLKKVSPPSTPPQPTAAAEDTLAPSNSASQAPYKTVPIQPSKAAEAVASLYYWHNKGSWEFLHKDECRIVVTAGLIEAYEKAAVFGPAGDSSGEHRGQAGKQPLIALELTPLVPIRRGTALDITIRSPPTERSKVTMETVGSNIMFRSRIPDDCDKLYGMINQSRINNPTYIALQNARGPYSHQPAAPGQLNSSKPSRLGGLFGWYGGSSRSSYRVSSLPTPSVGGASESSVGTMATAFSALKKFGAGNKMFSIARSTLTSRSGSRPESRYSTSTRSGSNSTPGSSSIEASAAAAGGIGLSGAKVRLYCRESASKWRDMGAARLTILPVSPHPSRPGTSSNSHKDGASGQAVTERGDAGNEALTTSSSGPPPPAAPQSLAKAEKRIIISGKKHGEVLLDACLGESCFERVARTGIAVSVWEAYNEVAKEGGVTGGSFKIYMIQMKSEAETAYTFGLVGKLRY